MGVFGYILWTAFVIGALALTVGVGAFMYAALTDSGYDTAATIATGIYAFLAGAAWLGVLFYEVAEGQKPPAGFIEWRGGSGPATKCEYVIKDDDQVVSTGKTVMVIEDSDTFTRCSTAGPK